MTLKIDGMRFGRLVALEKVGSVKKKVVWRFRCDCGTVTDLPATFVARGHTQSCGCLRIEASRESVARDIAGKRFGRLLVVGRSGTSEGAGRIGWNCVCDCGSEVVRSSKNLVNGTAASCGCRKREAGAENILARVVDYVGQRFGKLVVTKEVKQLQPGIKRWACACDCGGTKVARHTDIQAGRVISCGCAARGPHVTDPFMPAHARAVGSAAGATRRARKRGAGGAYTAKQLQEVFARQRYLCANCGKKLKLVGDHKIALAIGGSNHIENMEGLCVPCNSRKNAKDEIAWAQENGRLL